MTNQQAIRCAIQCAIQNYAKACESCCASAITCFAQHHEIMAMLRRRDAELFSERAFELAKKLAGTVA